MSLIKLLLCLSMVGITGMAQVRTQAKPVVNGSNIKAYMNAINITLLNNRQWVHFKFSAQGIAYPTGEVRLIYPKLVIGREFYGIELDPRSSISSSHFHAVTALADSICSVMGRKAMRKGPLLDASVYISEFQSVRVDQASAGTQPHSVTFSNSKRYILDSIVCI